MHIIVILISYNIIQHYLVDYKKILTMNDDYNIIIKCILRNKYSKRLLMSFV